MAVVISIENVSKYYRLGSIGNHKFYQDLNQWWAKIRSRPDPLLKIGDADHGNRSGKYILALRDVHLEVREGEILGFIGLNGAGKSTLLKILSQITTPTSGQIKIKGRVASLLEVGTGFHPELTGRENIYLNGAILGMTKAEIRRKFDEIVDFSGVKKFIDTPVKRYSSGMYVRLAFAVAAHLEPEILLIDEVLAVGDFEFQKKCLGKMHDVAHTGRTVLFVSHNMPSIATLCNRAVLLKQGKVELDGLVSDVVRHYILAGGQTTGGEITWDDPQTAPGNEDVRLHSVCVLSQDGEVTNRLSIEEDITIKIAYWNFRETAKYLVNINLKDQDGMWVLSTLNIPSASIEKDPWFNRPHPLGLFETVCRIPGNLLNNHSYSIYLAIAASNVESPVIRKEDILTFTIHDTGAMGHEHPRPFLGPVRPRLFWRTELK